MLIDLISTNRDAFLTPPRLGCLKQISAGLPRERFL